MVWLGEENQPLSFLVSSHRVQKKKKEAFATEGKKKKKLPLPSHRISKEKSRGAGFFIAS